jgi:hypothetical protein
MLLHLSLKLFRLIFLLKALYFISICNIKLIKVYGELPDVLIIMHNTTVRGCNELKGAWVGPDMENANNNNNNNSRREVFSRSYRALKMIDESMRSEVVLKISTFLANVDFKTFFWITSFFSLLISFVFTRA